MAARTGPVLTREELEVRPLEAGTWDLFAALVERQGGLFGGCWCVWFHLSAEERKQEDRDNRAIKKRLVEDGVAHAALVVHDGEAVAWAEYGTPEELPSIHHRKQYEAEQDVVPDYRITCIQVDKRYRGQGLSAVALEGAIDLIAADGGGVVEGYPHDVGDKRMSPSFLYNGTRELYERAGFEFVRPKGLKNTVMRRTVRARRTR
jgi:GNAT superfamily N-acetyltransferase